MSNSFICSFSSYHNTDFFSFPVSVIKQHYNKSPYSDTIYTKKRHKQFNYSIFCYIHINSIPQKQSVVNRKQLTNFERKRYSPPNQSANTKIGKTRNIPENSPFLKTVLFYKKSGSTHAEISPTEVFSESNESKTTRSK